MKISIPELKKEVIQLNKIQKYWEHNPYPTLIACGEMLYTGVGLCIKKYNTKLLQQRTNSIHYYLLYVLITISNYICNILPVPDKYRYIYTTSILFDVDYTISTKNAEIIIPNNKITLEIDYPLEAQYSKVIELSDVDGYSLNDLITYSIESYKEIYRDSSTECVITREKLNEYLPNKPFGQYEILKYHLHDLEIIEFDCKCQEGSWICKPIVRPKQ